MSDHLCNIIGLFISVHPYLIINVQLFSYIFLLILVIDYKKWNLYNSNLNLKQIKEPDPKMVAMLLW